MPYLMMVKGGDSNKKGDRYLFLKKVPVPLFGNVSRQPIISFRVALGRMAEATLTSSVS